MNFRGAAKMKRELQFYNEIHRQRVIKIYSRMQTFDAVHQSVAYLLGLPKVYPYINEIYNFSEDCIKVDALYKPWQTDTTLKVCRLAFNLWGYSGEVNISGDSPHLYTVNEIFDCEYIGEFIEVIRLRFPHYAP